MLLPLILLSRKRPRVEGGADGSPVQDQDVVGILPSQEGETHHVSREEEVWEDLEGRDGSRSPSPNLSLPLSDC